MFEVTNLNFEPLTFKDTYPWRRKKKMCAHTCARTHTHTHTCIILMWQKFVFVAVRNV